MQGCKVYYSPIVIDVEGKGFHMTDTASGVDFDMPGKGSLRHTSWTDPRFGNGWLALDVNGNGKIDSGRELFGNFTDHNATKNPNGFAALAYYDTLEGGGNGDGKIDARDAIFSKLVVWVDSNQNGISEPNEMIPLSATGIDSISLAYTLSPRVDQFHNAFRYKGSVTERSRTREAAYDVFLVPEGAVIPKGVN